MPDLLGLTERQITYLACALNASLYAAQRDGGAPGGELRQLAARVAVAVPSAVAKPSGVVKLPSLLDTAGPQVAVVNRDDTVQFRDVSIARDNGNTVDLASGVTPGDKVVLNISSQIVAGQKVRPGAGGRQLADADPPAPDRPR